MDRKRYELRLSRRDGEKLRHQPQPVVETFDLDRELDKTVGKHFIPMAAAAEGQTHKLQPHRKVWEFDFLAQYQIEVWRTDGTFKAPEVVSTSTHGWRD